ncbi:hypothetical protein AVEN_219624-1 [Araneus ventricosus]|uniref:Uncharacterized protein n=1 Tax=Araneus ventricosus TaxID=182803 RepID=A0A4Y2LIN0_ARAVE|nr:hypothetical protein AVEN_219624-1 [Araneus ventricosus]
MNISNANSEKFREIFGLRIERDLINFVCGFSADIPRSWIRWGTITCQISPHHLEYHFSSCAKDVLRKTAGGGEHERLEFLASAVFCEFKNAFDCFHDRRDGRSTKLHLEESSDFPRNIRPPALALMKSLEVLGK